MESLLQEIRQCTLCAERLPLGPRPVIQAEKTAKVLIIGQAPGSKVHASGIPWDDPSGRRLREWLAIDDATFYDPSKIAIMPMGFCYPGRGKSGDLPPQPICAKTWHQQVLEQLPALELILLIGQYSQQYYLKGSEFAKRYTNLTRRVEAYTECPAPFFVLPHPSPRNGIWLAKHPWFEEQVVPALRQRVHTCLKL